MDCVRPGLELVRAIFVPSRELSTLDLPTLERPRNATSAVAGTGNWSTPVAALMNLDKTRTLQFRVSGGNLQVGEWASGRHLHGYVFQPINLVPADACSQCLCR